MAKAALWVLAALVLAGGALLALSYARTDTYLGRWFAWRASDVGDAARFASRQIARSPTPRPLPAAATPLSSGPVRTTWRGAETVEELPALLERTGTAALLVVQGDEVVLEWYAPGRTRSDPVTSFSIAKSITALLVLSAVADGSVGSIDDPVTAYLPELAEQDPRYHQLTLRHLLNMRSGVRFRDHDLPWGDKARVYYEPRLRELVLSLPMVFQPGERFAYNSYNPVLLGLVLERATGMEPARYLEQRLWAPLGAKYAASWSVSRPGETLPKMESGVNATPVDFVKLGLALLAGADDRVGTAPAPPVLATTLLAEALPVDPLLPNDLRYAFGWWVPPRAGAGLQPVAATGHLGQYLYVYPDQGVVVARFGARVGKLDSWRTVFDQLVEAAAAAR